MIDYGQFCQKQESGEILGHFRHCAQPTAEGLSLIKAIPGQIQYAIPTNHSDGNVYTNYAALYT